ncbi:MAG: fasciclin domain-containing protein [Alphaproteobacteria bacterium]|nr:fasciclin domain-containing protein [Alphaproteobacteria bacterium]
MLKTLVMSAAALAFAAPAFAECPNATQARMQPIAHHGAHAHTQGDIVDVAVGAGQFSTLVAAVQAAGLVDTLKGDGPFTVFAPTDAAFAKLPAGTVENLLRPENRAQLTAILTYHVVPGRVTAADLAGRTAQPETVQGRSVSIDGRNGVKVNGANVVMADVAASNGVIHVIDTVLMPPAHH